MPLEDLVEKIIPCEMAQNCRNAPDNVRIGRGRCHECRLAVSGGGAGQHYRPLDRTRPHPVIEEEKRTARFEWARRRQQARQSRDRGRRRVLRNAERAERATEQRIITATRNSGRVCQDGDHEAAGIFALDTKLQSKRLHPLVNLAELEKIRTQASQHRKTGVLVLRNKDGRGVVAMAEEDFAQLLQTLKHRQG